MQSIRSSVSRWQRPSLRSPSHTPPVGAEVELHVEEGALAVDPLGGGRAGLLGDHASSWRAMPPDPVALQRLHYDARKRQVTLGSDKSQGPTAGTHTFEALEYLARLLTHVPDKNEVCVRYYGAYSVRRRARWRSLGILTETRTFAEERSDPDLPTWPALQARRRRWAELLQRIFEVDPLRCTRCGGQMRILAFVLDHDVVHAILRHMRRAGLDPSALPEHHQEASWAPPP